MKKIFTLLFSLLALIAFSQNLPKELHLSADGTRLSAGGLPTTGFYAEDKIPQIELTFPTDNFWAELTAAGDTDIMATLAVDGIVYDSVGVRFKGATSDFRNNSEKKSFNISVDAFIPNQDVKGYETLNLNGNYEDPSSMREIIYNHIGRYYTPALKTNFAELYVNGEYWGPYENVQQLNGEYIKEWFLSNDGTRWRALAEGALTGAGGGPGGGGPGGGGPGGGPGGGGPGGGGPGGGGNFGQGVSTLNYLGTDIAEYITNYTLKKTKKEDPWTDLMLSTEKLNTLPTDNDLYDNLKDYVDVDKSLWFLAHEILFTDSDGYVSKGGMDYYVYWEAETGRLVPLEYDGNSCLQLNSTEWSPLYRENETDFPLMNRLFASPELRQRYLAHFRTILEKYFTIDYLDNLIDSYRAKVESAIQNDTKRITEPAAFVAEIAALKTHIRARRDFLLNHVEMNVKGLDIASVSTVTTAPYSNEAVTITTAVSGAMGIDQVRLYYGAGIVGAFDRVAMTDNGDGTFSATIPSFSPGSYVRYYVEAIAADAAKTATYAPKGAEHDVYVYRVNVGESTAAGEVVINEFMASNDATVADQDGEFDDWIELYNTTDAAIDLTGYFISDNDANLHKYDIPDGTMIDANGYLIIWADEDGMQEGLHANFKLSAAGETIFLVNADTMVIDEIAYGQQTTDQSSARRPNGTGAFSIGAPTFNANNGETTSLNDVNFNDATLQVYPNPAANSVTIALQTTSFKEMTVQIFDVYGRIVHKELLPTTAAQISVGHLTDGLYFVVVNDVIGKKVMVAK